MGSDLRGARPAPHRYFDTSHAIIAATIANDLPELEAAVARLMVRAADNTSD